MNHAAPSSAGRALLVRAGELLCVLPLGHVAETFRPLPVAAVAGAPAFVLGVAVVRGAPVPVVDLARLVGSAPAAPPTRFVSVHAGDRSVALAVAAVLGVTDLQSIRSEDLPPLLRDSAPDAIERLGALDDRLLIVLRAARVLPEGAWTALSSGGGAR